jgi:tetratricopeptide (TPR) repeat protein
MEKAGVPVIWQQELAARIQIQKRAWGAALIQLEQVRIAVQNLPDPNARDAQTAQINVLMGTCYARLDEPDRALLYFQQALEAQPLYLPARVGLASALVALGHFERGLAEYKRIYEHDPSVGPEIARLLLGRNLRKSEGDRDWDEVNKILKRIPADNPDAPDQVILGARALWAQKKTNEAQEALRAALKKHPEKLGLWLALADLAVRPDLDDRDKPLDARMLDVLGEAEKALGDRIELRLARAQYWLDRKARGDKQAADALKQLEAPGKLKDEDLLNLRRGLGDLNFRAGDGGQAGPARPRSAASSPTWKATNWEPCSSTRRRFGPARMIPSPCAVP